MPRSIISIPIYRKSSTPDGAGGYTQQLNQIAGSPFLGRIFRRSELKTSGFLSQSPGETNEDTGLIISLDDPNAGVVIDDFAEIFGGQKVRILRVRRYTRSVQCDTVIGVD
jgi:hypothetical protein